MKKMAGLLSESPLSDDGHPEPSLLPGEIIVAKAINVLRFQTMADRKSGISGVLYATNFRLSFLTRNPIGKTQLNSVFQSNPDLSEAAEMYSDMQRELYIPQTCITDIFYYSSSTAEGSKVKKVRPGSRTSSKVHSLEICCKDFRVVRFGLKFTPKKDHVKMVNAIAHYQAPSSRSLILLFAFPYSINQNVKEDNAKGQLSTVPTFRSLPDWLSELERLSVDDTWRVATVNGKFQTCPSLPEMFVVLESLSDSDINRMSLHYIDSRLPTWCWSHPVTGVPMLCSGAGRPESIFLEKEETSFFRALSLLPCNTEHKEVKVVDLMKICPSIQELQQSFLKVKELCAMETSKEFWSIDSNWLTSLETSKWLNYIRLSLVAAMDVVESIAVNHSPVVIRETGGRDFVLVVGSLAQLILDSYYRTIRGFQTLIQKMWVVGGHQFLQRCNHVKKPVEENEKEDAGESPVFLHFIDCVYQLTQQFPSAFEFSETYLHALLDTLHACMFDTFLFDCEKQRDELCKTELNGKPMASLWDFVAEQLADSKNSEPYLNPLFEFQKSLSNKDVANGTSTESYLKVNMLAPAVKFWSGRYLRWIPVVHVSTGMGENSSLHFQQMILVNELRVLRHRLAIKKYEQSPMKKNPIDDNETLVYDGSDTELGNFSLDLETSKLLTPSLPFIGDLSLSKYCSGDMLTNGATDSAVDVGEF